MEKKKEQAKVLSQEMLADGIYSLWIETEAARTARPGQFVSVYTADASKLLPRPISICEIDKEGKKLRLVYRVTGEKTGTKQFSELKAGDTVPVIGPLGNGFPYEKAEEKKVFLMGGGIGVHLGFFLKLPWNRCSANPGTCQTDAVRRKADCCRLQRCTYIPERRI